MAVRRFVCRVVLGMALVGGAVTIPTAPPVHAAQEYGFFFSNTPMFPVGSNFEAGASIPLPPNAYLGLWASPGPSGGPGAIRLGPCGAPDRTVHIFNTWGSPATSTIFSGTGQCLVPTIAMSIYWHSIGTLGTGSGGLAYVPAQQTVIFDAPLPKGTVAVDIGSGVPSDRAGVALAATAWSDDGGVATIHRCGEQPADQTLMGIEPGGTSNVVYLRLGPGDTVCASAPYSAVDRLQLTVLGRFVANPSTSVDVPPTLLLSQGRAPGLVAVPPQRVLDTRTGIGASVGKVTAGGTLTLSLADQVPAGTTAVVLNVTATESERAGYLTVYPCGAARPDVSNLNYAAGTDVANLVDIGVGPGMSVCIYSDAPSHLLADIAGYFVAEAGDGFTPVTPARILDTRGSQPIGGQQTMRVQVAGQGGVPVGASAATLTLTSTRSAGWGYLTAYPCDAPRPDASNVNYLGTADIPNLVTVKLAADGSLCLFAYSTTDVLVDVAGYFTPGDGGSGFLAIAPVRRLDTRTQPSAASDVEFVQVDPPTLSASAVVANLTSTGSTASGFVTADACGVGTGNAVSNLNYVAGVDRANLATLPLSNVDTVCLRPSAPTELLFDVSGYFTTDPITRSELVTPTL